MTDELVEVWRVCSVVDSELINHDDPEEEPPTWWASAFVRGEVALTYDIGLRTYGIAGSPVFAFNNLDDARMWADNNTLGSVNVVLRCKAKLYEPAVGKCLSISRYDLRKEDVERFWKLNLDYYREGSWWDYMKVGLYHPATVLCEWVEPIEYVEE